MIVECPGCRSHYDVTGRPAGTRARCRCGTIFPLPQASETAGALMCPVCGAACAPDRSRCEYCSTVLAVVACPRCFGRLFAGARHCEHCGAEVDVPAQALPEGEARQRPCPRCAPQPPRLIANLVGGTLLDECPGCGGVWVDAAAFDRVVAEKDRQAALLALGSPTASPPPQAPAAASPARASATYIRCPDCSTLMNRINYGKRSGVVVDVCKAHGVWFDRDELRQVVEFVSRGGLDEARRRELEDLKRETAAQRSQAAAAAASARFADGHSSHEDSLFSVGGLLRLLIR